MLLLFSTMMIKYYVDIISVLIILTLVILEKIIRTKFATIEWVEMGLIHLEWLTYSTLNAF